MATRSNIAIVNGDKSITSIYCHWDGYVEYVGKILFNYYTTSARVNKLMQLGNLSQLCEDMCPLPTIDYHTFDNPQSNVCVAYGRDRGEKDQEAIVFEDLGEFEDSVKNSWVDYQYLFEDNKWMYRNVNNTLGWRELTSEVCEGQ